MMEKALFTKGVFRSVLEEIIAAQRKDANLVCYLQPFSSRTIKLLAMNPPSTANPLRLYASTTDNLSNVCYTAEIVGWENKQKLPADRLKFLNDHIAKNQPGEENVYMIAGKGKACINLISVTNMRKIPNPFSVANLVKVADGSPVRARTQAGGWSPVQKLPDWVGTEETVIKEHFDSDFEKEIERAAKDSSDERKKRLASASKFPEQIQVVSIAYRRNPDVVAEILKRANGRCERCGSDAPFIRAKDGSPYLETHHWRPLSEGGEDTVRNAGALCPNCHRELHFGAKH
jgi:5-methylcytosine-specific restriction enzyme A